MNETQLLTIVASLVAALFGLLCAILGWIGNKLFTKLEVLQYSVTAMKDDFHEKLTAIATELHEKVNGVKERLIAVETKCKISHFHEEGKD